MKRTISVLTVAFMLLSVLCGCVKSTSPESAPLEEDTQPSDDLPSVEYDAGTQTVYVKNSKDYTALSLPDEIKDARALEVHGDGFELSAYLVILREEGMDLQTELPFLIDRTSEGIRFIRQYLHDNAGEAYPSALAELPVEIKIDRTYGYKTDDELITLMYDESGTHREFLYLLALMDSDSVGWEHLGYAWYVGTCLNPFTEVTIKWPITPELPYYTQCIAGGVDPENVTAADYRTVYDACARVCFEKGLTHWGSLCESRPVTAEPDFSRIKDKNPGDSLLTAFTAASFLAWLDEAYGFEQISLFCFGNKTFEEAFGTEFSIAYKEWRRWIIETYPAE